MTIDLLVFVLLEVAIYMIVWRLSRHSPRLWKFIHANLAVAAFNILVVTVMLAARMVEHV